MKVPLIFLGGAQKMENMMKNSFIGATIIAMIVFWVLNFGSGIVIERQSMVHALISATIKAPIFATLFHFVHNTIARLFGWYKSE